jgi:hypothetical protein
LRRCLPGRVQSPSPRYEFSVAGAHLSPTTYQQMAPVQHVQQVQLQQVQLQPVPVHTRFIEKEKVVEIPVDRIVEKPVYIEVEKERLVDRFIEVEKEVVVVKHVEVPVERIVERFVEVPVDKIVEKFVEVPVDRIVEKLVEVEKEVVVVKHVEIPVERIVQIERQPELCGQCRNVLDIQNKACNVCPLVQRLNCPQAPVIVSQAGVKWSTKDAEDITVQVVHSQRGTFCLTLP